MIRHLAPGAFWGLDIERALINKGKELLGTELCAEKRPHLDVISPQSVAAAAAAKPTVLFSSKVLEHVHPEETEEYFRNILAIIGTSGRGFVATQFSNAETIHCRQSTWAHGAEDIEATVERLVGKCRLVLSEEGSREGARDPKLRKGWFLIVDQGNSLAMGLDEEGPLSNHMTVGVTAELAGQTIAQSEFETTRGAYVRNRDKIMAKALAKLWKHHSNIPWFDEGVGSGFANATSGSLIRVHGAGSSGAKRLSRGKAARTQGRAGWNLHWPSKSSKRRLSWPGLYVGSVCILASVCPGFRRPLRSGVVLSRFSAMGVGYSMMSPQGWLVLKRTCDGRTRC